jgi:tRNA/rRNA methyltransferase
MKKPVEKLVEVVPQPVVILVEPQLGENIGMAARAMANFGLQRLRLVNPRDGWPSAPAVAAAARALHVLDHVRLFDNLSDAVADLNFVYATTARNRDMTKPINGPEEAARYLVNNCSATYQTGILFGRERWGLNNGLQQ